MAVPPTGTVTFLFTDIEGSTRMWERDPSAMQPALGRHDEILWQAIETNDGYVFKTVGDAFCAAFGTATDALEAALAGQRALRQEPWEEACEIRARMALHTGAAEERGGDYFGPAVNRVARLLSAGHGGQTLLSLATMELVRDQLPDGAEPRDLGERRLKDLFRPERVFQLTAPDLPSSFPPLRTLDARLNNLPTQLTPLIGREREVGEVCERLQQEEVRLLTLTGPGGTGKTRLSLQAGADLLEDFEHGVFFVELAAITDPALFFSEVAGALGLRESGGVPLPDLLKEYLSRRELLLVLDNFEQLSEAAPLTGELLSAAPKCKVLVTSRIPLDLYGEHEYAVPPLSAPDPRRLPSVAVLSQYEAVRLFIERAGAAKAGFEITNENAPAIAEICARLDGLPLAIELAAARIKLLPPKALLGRLSNRLKLLTGGAKNLPARQRTLRGALEWSYELLDEGEKTLFARLSVFSGGRTIEAVEAICDAKGDLPMDSLDGVSSLLDKSLLRREEGPEEEPRFAMLETIHEFAREKLEQGDEAEAVKRAHAGYFLSLAEEAEPELVGPEQVGWMDRLEAEHDNMRAALRWSLKGGDPELGLGLASALAHFWIARGYFGEGRGWLEEALESKVGGPTQARAKALLACAKLALEQGDYDRAKILAEEALTIFRELGGDKETADSLFWLGWVAMYLGEEERAEALLEESLMVARESGDAWSIGCALIALAVFAGDDLDRAEAYWEESLALGRRHGDRRLVATVLYNRAYTALARGEYERAEALFREFRTMMEELREILGTAQVLMCLGIALTRRGEYEQARALLGEGLVLFWELGSKGEVAESLESLAGMAGALGDFPRTARLWAAADALREALGAPWLRMERRLHGPYLEAIHSRADEAAWARAWEEGRKMAMDEAIAYALEGTEGA